MQNQTPPTSTSEHRVTKYARQVVTGEILAGPHVRAACKRHLKDLDRESGVYFDCEAADHALGYFKEVLRLNGGEFEGVAFDLLDWQAFIVGSVFGWKSDDGFRRFRMAFVETGKGSGKSPLAAGIGLYMLTADQEPRAEIYAAASKHDQAKILFRDAVAMVQQSPKLNERLNMSGGVDKHNIAYIAKGSFFRPISSEREGKGQSGPRPHCALLDEIHEHPTNAMVEFMRAGTKGRRQALIFMITNSGSDRESVCYDYHDYAIKVSGGELEDDSFFSYVCALDEEDDPLKDEECWIKANPSLGITFGHKYLREQVRQARGMPSKQNLVLRLNFCVWTDSDTAWISRNAWEAVEADFDISQLKGIPCYGGLDLSKKLDLTALACAIANPDGTFDAWVEFWTPEDTLLEREERDRVPYRLWVEQGYLNTTPGKSVQYGFVVNKVAEMDKDNSFVSIAFDRWKIDEFESEMDGAGLFIDLVPHGQGYKDISPALDKLESLIIDGKIRIKSNPVLRWNVASARIEMDAAENRKFHKKKSTGRIDGLVALCMAISRAENTDHYVTGSLLTL